MLGHILGIVSEIQNKEMKNQKPDNVDWYIYCIMGFIVCMVILSFFIGTN